MRVRCPNCHESTEVDDNTQLSEIACPSCGSQFSLVSDHTLTYTSGSSKTIGHFELVDEIGVGAFGSVWMSRDTQLDRTVAVKIPRKGQLDPQESEQFLREARAAAQLKHPNIVTVHEVGREDGQVYIVSDYVEGLTLADWLVGQQLTSRAAAALCLKIAEALHHAHEAGVVHRDLKPTNIILDGDNEPHIMDFGLARREAGEVTMTMQGKVLGTPAYMSPEQARGEAHEADRRSDVYSLGVILYEMLTGERPFRGNVRMLLKQVIDDDPPSPRRLNSSIPRDLETLCLKCLEKEPRKRYSTAEEGAEELRRFLGDKPIQARPISSAARLSRSCKRNPVVSGLVLAVVATMAIGTAISMHYAREATGRAGQEEVLRQDAEKAVHREAELRRLADLRAYVADMSAVQLALSQSDLGTARRLLSAHVPKPGREDLRGFEWRYFWEESKGDEFFTLNGHSNVVGGVAVLPDSKTLISSSWDGTVRVWDIETRRHLTTHRLPHQVFAASHTGQFMATGNRQGVTLWDMSDPMEPSRVFHKQEQRQLTHLAFSPSDTLLAIGAGQPFYAGGKGDVTIIDCRTWKEVLKLSEAGARAVFSPDGIMIATASWNGDGRLWDLEGRLIRSIKDVGVGIVSMAFTPDGNSLVTCDFDMDVDVWDITTGTRVTSLMGHTSRVFHAVFSPDGTTLATGSTDQTIRLWGAQDFRTKAILRGHGRDIRSLAFSPDGQILVSGGQDEAIKVWQLGTTTADTSIADIGPPVVFSPDSKTVATQRGPNSNLAIWSVSTCQLVADLGPERIPVAFVDEGSTLVAVKAPNVVEYWNLSSRLCNREVTLPLNPVDAAVKFAALSSDGNMVATGLDGRTITIWEVASGQPLITVNHRSRDSIWFSPFSPDGTKIVHLGTRQIPTFHNLESGHSRSANSAHRFFIAGNAFSPDGRICATTGADGQTKLWDVTTGDEIASLVGHKEGHRCVAFSPDGKTLATSSVDRSVKLWNVQTHRDVATIPLDVTYLAFSPDARMLACLDAEGTLHLLHAASFGNIEIAEKSRN